MAENDTTGAGRADGFSLTLADTNVIPFTNGKKRDKANQLGKLYRYPKALLYQEYFCRLANGKWVDPSMSLYMLAHVDWKSPLAALLEELKRDGHDIQGALIEYRALVEGARAYNEERFSMQTRWMRIDPLPAIREMLSSS